MLNIISTCWDILCVDINVDKRGVDHSTSPERAVFDWLLTNYKHRNHQMMYECIIFYPIADRIMATVRSNLRFSGKDRKEVDQTMSVINKLSQCMAKMLQKKSHNLKWLVMANNDEISRYVPSLSS